MADQQSPEICDYEGSDYRTAFWEGRGRDYEDQVERQVLRRLLPASGKRLLELGAGFGRITDEYKAYDHVVLLDYSFSQMEYARDHHGTGDRYTYVAANAYKLPFRPGVFDGVTMIRVIHHMAQVDDVLEQIRQVITPGGRFILEFANKRNAKAILRYALRRQKWNPFDQQPVEFVALNFDFHPDFIASKLAAHGFDTETRIPVSFLRLPVLKKLLPTPAMVGVDALLQRTGLLYSPSVFTLNRADTRGENHISETNIFACPECKGDLSESDETMVCADCGRKYAIRGGIYDFKAPLEA